MKLRHLNWFALLCPVLLLAAGCDQGRPDQRKTTVRIANVAPSFVELSFRREQTNGTQLIFKGSTEASYGEDTYDFYVDSRTLTADLGRTWSFTQDVRDGTVYTFVLTEDAGEIEPVILEYPSPTANDTQARVVGVHAAGGFGAIDVYLERAGVGIAGATPQATLAFQQPLTARTLPTGDYEITLTEAGNPSNVLLTSGTINLGSAPSTFIITAESGEGTAALSVLLLQTTTAVLYDRNATAEMRVINGAADTLARDFAINREFSPPLFSAIPFATATSYATVPVAAGQPINVTPVGNPGVLELDQLVATTIAQRSTLLFAGNAGTLTHILAGDDGRRILAEAKVRFFNAASQFTALTDFVLVPAGEDPTTAFQRATLSWPGISLYDAIPPGDYDLALRQNVTTTLLAGPVRVTLAAGGIYGVMAINGASTSTADIVLLDDFLTPSP
jgi:hypothetical protein